MTRVMFNESLNFRPIGDGVDLWDMDTPATLTSMTDEDRGAELDEILADPLAWKRKVDAELRRARPDMTDAQIDESWNAMAAQLGLPLAPPR